MLLNIQYVDALLGADGLTPVGLNALLPDINHYEALLFQPRGELEASERFVRNLDRKLAAAQHRAFLDLAKSTGCDLAVAPEYSCPWSTLEQAISDGVRPPPGALWALGCESITPRELDTWRSRNSGRARIYYESIEPDGDRFLDALVYVFQATEASSAPVLIVLIQFKTCPMGGDHFEVVNLVVGNTIYGFGQTGSTTRLFGFICSDVLSQQMHSTVQAIHDRCLIIHIQLNKEPTNSVYRRYRQQLYELGNDEREVICLNWAQRVTVHFDGSKDVWKGKAASGWYIRTQQLSAKDEELHHNHGMGMYVTRARERNYNLFLNYDPHVFRISATKVFQKGLAVHLRRSGPRVLESLVWEPMEERWAAPAYRIDDGFGVAAAEIEKDLGTLPKLAETAPLVAERLACLSTGGVTAQSDWHHPDYLDVCQVDDTEGVKRLTFAQDQGEAVCIFRRTRLLRFANLIAILRSTPIEIPALTGFSAEIPLTWVPTAPHSNLVQANGTRATVVYLGEATAKEARRACDILVGLLQGQKGTKEWTDQIRLDPARVVVWYSDSGKTIPVTPAEATKIDADSAELITSITGDR